MPPSARLRCRVTTLSIPRTLFALGVGFVLACGLPVAQGANLTWDATPGTADAQDGTGTWSNGGANWRNTDTLTDNVNFANGDAVTFGAGSGAAGSITLSGTVNTNSITFNTPGSGNYTISGGTGISMTVGTIVANANATISSVITGTGILTKSGTGTLILSGANTYTGLLDITQGAVSLRHASAAGTTAGGVTVRSGAAVEFQGGFSYGSETLALNGTGVSGTGAIRNTGGNNTWAGSVSLASATQVNSDSGTLTLNGVISGAVGNALTIVTATSGAGVTFGGSSSNTFTGPLHLNAGLLILAKTPNPDSQLPQAIAANVTVNIGNGTTSAILQLNRSHQISDTGTVLNFSGTAGNQGILRMNGFSDTVGTIKSTGGAGIIESGLAVNASTLTVNNSTNDTYTGVIRNGTGGTLHLTKANTGTLTLTGTNTYTGTTTVRGGTLEITGTGALTSTSNVVLSTGGTLKISTASNVSGGDSLSNTATITLNGGTLAVAEDGTTVGGTYVETLGAATAVAGASSISTNTPTASQTLVVLASLARNKGATVNFSGPGLGLTPLNRIVFGSLPPQDHGLIGGWATVGNEFAKDGAGGVTALTAADYVTSGEADWTFEANAKITGNTTLTTDRRVNSLNIAAAGVTTVNLNGESLRVESGGLLASGTSAVTISNGTLTAGAGGGSRGEVILHQNSSALLDITATVADNGSHAVALVKSGTGTARLSGANNFTGGVYLNTGTLQMNNAAAINAANTLAVEGGTLDLNGHNLTVSSLSSQDSNTTGLITNTNAGGGVKTLTAGSDNKSSSYSGQLGANLNFTKTGAGTFTLNQSNASYAGVITVAQGTLATGSPTALGATGAASKTVVQAGATLNINKGIHRDEVLEVAGHGVNGLGAVILGDPSDAVLGTAPDAQNLRNATLTGHTTLAVHTRYDFDNVLAGGGFNLTKVGAAELALEGSGVLNLGDVHIKQSSVTWSGSADLGNVANTLYVDHGAIAQFYNKANDSKRITLSGGTLRRAGNATTAATLDVDGGLKLAAGASSITGSGSILTFQLNTLQRDVGATLNLDTSAGLATTDSDNDAGGILGGFITVGNSNWAKKDTLGADGAIVAFTAYAANDFAAATNNVNVTGAQNASNATVNSLRMVSATTTTLNLTGTNTIVSGGILIGSSGAATISGGTLRGSSGGDLVVIHNGSAQATISSVIANNGTATALTKSGTGTLALTGNNTYSGGTFIVGGILSVSQIADTGNSSLGNSSSATDNIITLNGGTLYLTDTGTDSVTGRNVALMSGGGRIEAGAGRRLELSGTISGETLLTGEGSYVDSGALTIGGNVVFSGSTSNTYSGRTAVSIFGATLLLDKSGGATAIAGNLQIGGSTVRLLQSHQIADTSIVTASLSATLDLAGNTEVVGGLTGVASSVRGSSATGVSGAFETQVAAGASYSFGGTMEDGTGGGKLSYTKSGDGTQILSGTNTYTGQTTVSGGVLQLGEGGTTGSLAAASNVVLSGGSLVINRSDSITFSNAMSGTGNFTVAGTGAVTINSANNTYGGTTEVRSGFLFATNASGSATGTSALQVHGTGRLGGDGSIAGPVTVRDGGQITPGNTALGGAVGTLTFTSDLTVNRQAAHTVPSIVFQLGGSGATIYNDAAGIAANMENLSAYYASKVNDYENEDGEHDRLLIGGALNLDAGATISLDNTLGYTLQAGDVFDLMDWVSINLANAPGDRLWSSSQDLILPTLEAGLSYDLSLFESNGIVVVIGAVPEPGRAMLLMFGLAGLVLRRRRRV